MHLKPTDIKQFKTNTMETDQMIQFLEHLDSCGFCLEQLLSDEEPSEEAKAPRYLKNQILTRAGQADVRASKSLRETSKKMQLFYYSLRTAAGVAAALFLLFSLGNADFSFLYARTPVSTEAQLDRKLQEPRRDYLKDFSTQLNLGLEKGSHVLSSQLNHISNFFNGGK